MGSVVSAISDTFLGTDFSGKRAAEAALGSQQAATNEAIGVNKEQFGYQKDLFNPYLDIGKTALSSLASGNFMAQDPGYQFRLSEGMKAINNAAAARGLGNSGATLKALAGYGQNVAAQEYGNAFNRQMGLAGMGQQAAGALGNASMNYGQNLSNLYTGMGNARAASGLAVNQRQANQLSQDIAGLFQMGSSALGGGGGGGIMSLFGG